MRSTTVKKGSTRAAHRSLFYAMGYTEEELKKPLIGICNAQNEIIPGHMDLDRIAKAVKYGVLENGGMYLLYREDGGLADIRGVDAPGDYAADESGSAVSEEPSVLTLLTLISGPVLRHKGQWPVWLGVERAQQAAQRAELALLVLDGSAPLTREDEEAIAAARQARRMLVLVNKADLPQVLDTAALRVRFGEVIPLSARSGAGVDALCRAVEELFAGGETPRGELLTNARQAESAQRALDAVRRAEQALRSGLSPDAVLTDAEEALEALAEFSGKRVRDDLVATIFSRFCVGK